MSKNMLITGANRGIGLALVTAYVTEGWNVIACCREPEKASSLSELALEHPRLAIHELDVTDHDAISQLADKLQDTSLDLLINNAGYYGPKGYGFGNTSASEWRKAFEINVIAPLKIAEAFYPHLKTKQTGTIVSLSSKVGSMTENTSGGGYIYRSTKAALNSVMKSLSNDLTSEGIICVALHPGWVKTEMGGDDAQITPDESAAGLKKVIENLKPEQSGGFFNYLGDTLPW